MNKVLVVYYSNTGNNSFLANKIAAAVNCEVEMIKPRFNAFVPLMLFSSLKRSFGIKALQHDIAAYDTIILCGPIWMGKLIAPLRDFMLKYIAQFKQVYFVSCCGTGFKVKDDKFGHAHVFSQVQTLLANVSVQCTAFPIGLVLPGAEQNNPDVIMKARLSDDNFKGSIMDIFNQLISKILKQ